MFGSFREGKFRQSFFTSDFVLDEELKLILTATSSFANTPSPQIQNALVRVMGAEKIKFRDTPCYQMRLQEKKGRHFTVPAGVSIQQLTRSHGADVAQLWQYVEENGGAIYAEICLERYIGFGAFSDSDGKMIGTVMCHRDQSIGALVVVEEWQRNGIARTLVSHLIREMEARNFSLITTQAVESNDRSIALFESLGFVKYEQMVAWVHVEELRQ
jgi:GNAT superfamily N-acetyltransferase